MAVKYLFVLVLVNLCGDCGCKIAPKNNPLTMPYIPILKTIQKTETQQEIVIPVMIHLDKAVTRRMPKIKGLRKRLKFSPKAVLLEAEKFFNVKSLNQKVHLKLVNVKTISNKTVTADENVNKYLRSYCLWQKSKKVKGDRYFSVLLTGMNIYYIGKNGEKVRQSTGRTYMSSICSMNKSCAIVKWNAVDLAYLMAHEIAHSLGVYHDGYKNVCKRGFIMDSQYTRQKIPQKWSNCSRNYLQKFLRNKRNSWCVTKRTTRFN